MRPAVKCTLYYVLVSLGYASFLTEIVFAKFYYDSGVNGLDSLSRGLLRDAPNAALQKTLAGVAAGLNVIACIALIAPVDNAQKLLYVEESGEVVSPILVKRPSCLAIILQHLLAFAFLTAMLSYFIIISAANWLGVYDWMRANAALNYVTGAFIILTGLVYNILLSLDDIAKSTLSFQGLNCSMTIDLWRLSRGTYLIALSKFMVAVVYKSAVAGFVGQALFNKILDLPEYQKIATVFGVACCFLVMVLTRYPSTLKVYLAANFTIGAKPDAVCIHEAERLLKLSWQWQIMGRSVIRATGGAAFMLGLVLHHLDYAYISIFLSASPFVVLSVWLFLYKSMYVVDYQAKIRARAAELLLAKRGDDLKGKSLSLQIIADIINIGSLIATALLASYSMIVLFSDAIGLTNAAILASAVSLESIWVSFFYYRDKYYDALQSHYNAGGSALHWVRNKSCTIWYGQSAYFTSERKGYEPF